jgi:hypothetical protein
MEMLVACSLEDVAENLPEYGAFAESKVEEITVKYQIGSVMLPWTWYPYEYDKESRCFFGFVDGDFAEIGSFSLDELKTILAFGEIFETPKNLKEIQDNATGM